MPDRPNRRRWILGAGCLWLLMVCAGTRSLLDYSYAQGKPGTPPRLWPAASRIHRPAGKSVLLMAVHARCTCTMASLTELQEFMDRTPDRERPATYVIFHAEGGDGARTKETELWRKASAIPAVMLIADDGTEAGIFGANTSGQTMLYDATGKLRFAGGITGARGHEGENYGLNALLAAAGEAMKTSGAAASTPVFGCPLQDPDVAEVRKSWSWKRY